uniref:Uncharacterized protein n=1 Tax=Populus davidiana TaxID=266767 RepID=A0A6M2FB78_9ROSI
MYLMNSQHTTCDMLTSKRFSKSQTKTFINILFVYLLVHFIPSSSSFFHLASLAMHNQAESYILCMSKPKSTSYNKRHAFLMVKGTHVIIDMAPFKASSKSQNQVYFPLGWAYII